MTDARVTALRVPPRSVRKCQHCDRAATASVTLGNLGDSTMDRTTFYCSTHDISEGLPAVLAYLRPKMPDVVGVIRAVA